MKTSELILNQARADIGIGLPFVRGVERAVRNCWHFCTDGNSTDFIFTGDEDFIHGMNLIFFVARKYHIIVLAFCLMDTHVHFVLYGEFEQCNAFIHEYVRRTSIYVRRTRGDAHKFREIPIAVQKVEDERYLKSVICYVVKNPAAAGLNFTPGDYPWSSGALYFRRLDYWTSPSWGNMKQRDSLSVRQCKKLFLTNETLPAGTILIDNLIFPGEYVEYRLVEDIFRTCKSFSYFMGMTRESDVESRGGSVSRLSIPLGELRQYREEISRELFGTDNLRALDTTSRVKLARILKSRYNSSVKQICRACGLVYDQAKSLI